MELETNSFRYRSESGSQKSSSFPARSRKLSASSQVGLLMKPGESRKVKIKSAQVQNIEKQTTWKQATFLLTGAIMGTGVLSLPWACSRLGWFLGLSSCFVFALIAGHCGLMLAEVRNRFYPEASSYSDLALKTGGRRFADITKSIMLFVWAGCLPYFFLTCTVSLRAAFPGVLTCFYQYAIVVAFALVFPLQLRTLHFISYLALPSTLAVVLAVSLIVLELLISEQGVIETTMAVPANVSGLSVYSSMGAFVFAYLGQAFFLEVMQEMKDSTLFPKAVVVANTGMMLVYV